VLLRVIERDYQAQNIIGSRVGSSERWCGMSDRKAGGSQGTWTDALAVPLMYWVTLDK
jgi:hypothetical protein